MGFWWNVLRVAVAAVTVVAVSELSGRFPRLGALLLSLPVISILAFIFSWAQHRNLAAVSQMARETLVLVPLGLVFFVPLALAERLHWSFWPAFALGVILAALMIGLWFRFDPMSR
ncbi:MAG: hypothetical protein WD738_18860 [Pirellulales bacterium]